MFAGALWNLSDRPLPRLLEDSFLLFFAALLDLDGVDFFVLQIILLFNLVLVLGNGHFLPTWSKSCHNQGSVRTNFFTYLYFYRTAGHAR